MGVSNRTFLLVAATVAATAFPDVDARTESTPPHTDTMLTRSCNKHEKCLFHWTLTSRLGHMLEMYEKTLGHRNRAYRILGIEFTTARRPRTWYPNFGNGLQSVIVQLTHKARYNRNLALFQLGHEAFHLLEPIKPGTRGSFFEEGLASYFAVTYLDRIGIANGASYIAEKDYRTAYDLIVRLAALHSDFYSRLRRLREQHRSFSRVSTDDIRAAFPEAPAAVARQLSRPFGTPL